MSRVLVVDIGNTQMVFGLYEGKRLMHQWRLSSGRPMTADELAWQLDGFFMQKKTDPASIEQIMAASVVPNLDTLITEACQSTFSRKPAFVGSADVKTGMAVDYKNPKDVGADRICNAVAARNLFGAPVITVDCGTATTFDVVSEAGHYAGGLILPGLQVGLDALCRRTAKLPAVPFQPVRTLIGRDTISSIQAGAYWSAVDGLGGIIRRLHAETGYAGAPVIATGGYAAIIREELPEINHLELNLTLKGLQLLANHNKDILTTEAQRHGEDREKN